MLIAFALIALEILWRIALASAPDSLRAFHFTPMLAVLLFFGSRVRSKWMWLAAVGSLAATDVFLNYFYAYPLSGDAVISWLWYAGMIWLGSALYEKRNAARVAGAALAGSVSFFLISNFGTWLFWYMYPKTLAGLMAAYVAGIPFYRNQFAADLIFTAAIFGLPALLKLPTREHSRELGA